MNELNIEEKTKYLLRFFDHIDWTSFLESIFTHSLRIIFILLIGYAAIRFIRLFMARLRQQLSKRYKAEDGSASESYRRAETLTDLLRQWLVFIVYLILFLVILEQIGINIGPILASAGIAGLAIGFGAQNLVRDVISGFFMIVENQVRVGDVATINGTGGLVEHISFRTIVLRDLGGVVHIFPHGTITTMSNMTREWSAYVLDISISYKDDPDVAVNIMKRVGEELRADPSFGPLMIDDIEVWGVDNFADSAVVIKGRLKTRPLKQWDVGREYRRRLKKSFDAAGITIPFPHRTLYFGGQDQPFDILQTLKAPDGAPNVGKTSSPSPDSSQQNPS